jgi:uncharacterized protein (TIGR00730 family)
LNVIENGTICVFCGSSDQIDDSYRDAATAMGQAIATSGFSMVYGGGATGLMGTIANSVLGHNGRVIGVIPKAFHNDVLAHSGLSELHVVDTMHQRKAKMVDLADAFVALPGGFGTFEELFEVLTWAQVGFHNYPIGLLDTNQYFEPCFKLIEHAHDEGFIYVEHRDLIVREAKPDKLLNRLAEYRPPKGLKRWVHREEAEE